VITNLTKFHVKHIEPSDASGFLLIAPLKFYVHNNLSDRPFERRRTGDVSVKHHYGCLRNFQRPVIAFSCGYDSAKYFVLWLLCVQCVSSLCSDFKTVIR